MSAGITAAGWAAIAAVSASTISAAVSYQNGQQQAKQNEAAMRQAQANADRQALQAEQDMNRANQKRADTSAILSAASQGGKSGASGTMLTGPQGVSPDSLLLGKTSLLGQ